MQTIIRKPEWLDKKISLKKCERLKGLLHGLKLNTVCQQAACPNISECFSKGEATFLILGNICTRDCRFCAVIKGKPVDTDPQEPLRVAEAIERLNLSHVVITSVTRDDIYDGGARVFAETVKAIRGIKGAVTVEVLIPDFKGREDSILKIVRAQPDIIGHNVETVQRLYKEVRPMADYKISLKVLKVAKGAGSAKGIYTKSGIMLGLGEAEEEILEVFCDLRNAGCDFLSIGQYLAPSRSHFPVKEYVTPCRFQYYKQKALEMGFLYVASAPYVRSSYNAKESLMFTRGLR